MAIIMCYFGNCFAHLQRSVRVGVLVCDARLLLPVCQCDYPKTNEVVASDDDHIGRNM
jgi:hypothetical protein